jgi:hypothetical protein
MYLDLRYFMKSSCWFDKGNHIHIINGEVLCKLNKDVETFPTPRLSPPKISFTLTNIVFTSQFRSNNDMTVSADRCIHGSLGAQCQEDQFKEGILEKKQVKLTLPSYLRTDMEG